MFVLLMCLSEHHKSPSCSPEQWHHRRYGKARCGGTALGGCGASASPGPAPSEGLPPAPSPPAAPSLLSCVVSYAVGADQLPWHWWKHCFSPCCPPCVHPQGAATLWGTKAFSFPWCGMTAEEGDVSQQSDWEGNVNSLQK